VLHSPDDLSIQLLTESDASDDWDWVRWLPHAELDMDLQTSAIGNDADTTTSRLKELQQLIGRRRDSHGARSRQPVPPLPHVLVVVDGAKRLRSVPGMLSVLREGPDFGIYCICLDSDPRLLPEECGAVLSVGDPDDSSIGTLEVQGRHAVSPIVLDQVGAELAEMPARSMASIHRIGGDDGVGGVPPTARFLDLAGLEPPAPESIVAQWMAPGRRPRSLIGAAEHGPLFLDLASDGPHGLIAGTTGSGKSELLQTLVAGLAANSPPDELNFVLIDYKGGAAFRDCKKLPHTVGMVTDLDPHLTERALRSLRAELKRREHVLAQAGIKDIEDYQDAASRGRIDLEQLPRLVIVIDEFAILAVELPEFIKGLVGIAQLGRALGVHLILATQRPTGVVSPEIRANSNFAIALRVVNATESTDIINRPDAATITPSTPGRAYLRISQESPILFQSARIGGRRPGIIHEDVEPVAFERPWSDLGYPHRVRTAQVPVSEDETDLHLLVQAIVEAAERQGLRNQRQPWLDALPETLPIEILRGSLPSEDSEGVDAVVFGLCDIPEKQAQHPALIDLTAGRHLLMAGSPRSGRSTLLRTIAASIGLQLSVDDVHLYGLDCGNGSLLALRELPHCGAITSRSELDRVERLLGRLSQEVKTREEQLISRGLTHIAEQRSQPGEASPWPYIVLLVDGWEGFTDAFHEHNDGQVEQALMELLRSGGAVGLTVIMTGDRSALSTTRVSSLFEERYALRFNDRDDYALADLMPRKMPDHVTPGRAFRAVSGNEVQIALVGSDPSGPAQAMALAAVAEKARTLTTQNPPGSPPFRIDALPTRIHLHEAEALSTSRPKSGLDVLVGVGGDELRPWWANLGTAGPGFVVVGPPASGRSTALHSMAVGFVEQGSQVIFLSPRPSPLSAAIEGKEGVTVVSGTQARSLGVDSPPPTFDPARRLAVIVDDAETIDPDNAWLAEIGNRTDGLAALVIAGAIEPIRDGFRGFPVVAKRSGLGLLLSPRTHLDANVFGANLPRGAGFSGPPGRAYFFERGRAVALVQIPQAVEG
jgi:S-DNA-T family DNA segregation ATPase FtsK/SpoIIIE